MTGGGTVPITVWLILVRNQVVEGLSRAESSKRSETGSYNKQLTHYTASLTKALFYFSHVRIHSPSALFAEGHEFPLVQIMKIISMK